MFLCYNCWTVPCCRCKFSVVSVTCALVDGGEKSCLSASPSLSHSPVRASMRRSAVCVICSTQRPSLFHWRTALLSFLESNLCLTSLTLVGSGSSKKWINHFTKSACESKRWRMAERWEKMFCALLIICVWCQLCDFLSLLTRFFIRAYGWWKMRLHICSSLVQMAIGRVWLCRSLFCIGERARVIPCKRFAVLKSRFLLPRLSFIRSLIRLIKIINSLRLSKAACESVESGD